MIHEVQLTPRQGYVETVVDGVRVYRDTETGEIYRSDPPEKPTMGGLQQENKLLRAQLQAQTERSDFIEDCLAEMAGVVYSGGEE